MFYDMDDLHERISPGVQCPAGECPATVTSDDPHIGDHPCRSLVYYTDIEIAYRRTPNVLEQIVEAIE
jgi:hypothetical protein